MKTAKELKLTPTQYKNLAKLTVFVRDKVASPRFNINYFFMHKNERWGHTSEDACPLEAQYECGTTACFLGYGIPAGIKARKGETWEYYCKRCFGIDMGHGMHSISGKLYELLFNEEHVNSKAAAAKRGAWVLMNGLPDVDDYDLCKWEVPRSFKPDWDAIEKIANN